MVSVRVESLSNKIIFVDERLNDIFSVDTDKAFDILSSVKGVNK